MKNNNPLIQALMIQIVWRARTAYWNINQKEWEYQEQGHDCAEWFWPLESISIGGFRVDVVGADNEDFGGDDKWLVFSFDGISIQSELSSKRLFHYGVHKPVLTDEQWVDWFNRILAEIHKEDVAGMRRLGVGI